MRPTDEQVARMTRVEILLEMHRARTSEADLVEVCRNVRDWLCANALTHGLDPNAAVAHLSDAIDQAVSP